MLLVANDSLNYLIVIACAAVLQDFLSNNANEKTSSGINYTGLSEISTSSDISGAVSVSEIRHFRFSNSEKSNH